jgi:hypothetical protein
MFEPQSCCLCGDTSAKHFIGCNEDLTVGDVSVDKEQIRAICFPNTQDWRAA